jgi:hypothetical protein
MDKRVYLGAEEIERVFGSPSALDDIDVVTAVAIVDYIRSRPALGKADRVALVAIAFLAEDAPDKARQLIAELAS